MKGKEGTLSADFKITALKHGVNQTLKAGVSRMLKHGVNQTLKAGVSRMLRHGVNQTLKHGVDEKSARRIYGLRVTCFLLTVVCAGESVRDGWPRYRTLGRLLCIAQ